MSQSVYITKVSHYFPNGPISNEEMEEYLGIVNQHNSKSKRIILRNNGITNRYYAITKAGETTHTNAELTALAVRALANNNTEELSKIELLSCGTSSSDQLMPSHAVMVHGHVPELGAIEVVSPSGVCCAGMHSLKYAYMSIKSEQSKLAVATGSERISKLLRAENFEEESKKLEELEGNGFIAFEKDFLRFMLSDGAGAAMLSNTKNEKGISLRIDWLEGVSYAHQMEPCMYMAADKENGAFKGYAEYKPNEIISKSILSIKQDVKLLGANIVHLGFDKLKVIFDERNINVNDVNFFLPHMSSQFFKDKIYDKLKENGMEIPYDKWFTNLTQVGNVGSASIYLMLDELFHSGKLKVGDQILLAVPESSRFSYMFGMLTVC
jgi:3-oxoacyl-[acyl-carrier-protein] synthase-3